jgi:hypothetical protein
MGCRATVAQRRRVPSDAGECVRAEMSELHARIVDRLRAAQARASQWKQMEAELPQRGTVSLIVARARIRVGMVDRHWTRSFAFSACDDRAVSVFDDQMHGRGDHAFVVVGGDEPDVPRLVRPRPGRTAANESTGQNIAWYRHGLLNLRVIAQLLSHNPCDMARSKLRLDRGVNAEGAARMRPRTAVFRRQGL